MTFANFKPTKTTSFKSSMIAKPNPKGCLIAFIALVIVVGISVLIGHCIGL